MRNARRLKDAERRRGDDDMRVQEEDGNQREVRARNKSDGSDRPSVVTKYLPAQVVPSFRACGESAREPRNLFCMRCRYLPTNLVPSSL